MARSILGLTAAAMVMLLATSASAHICLTSPMMRGSHPDLYPGDPLCYQRTGNCGDLVKGAPTATYVAGTPTVLTFQQNMNHFWMPKPGYFDLYVSYDDEKHWEMLGSEAPADFPANNMNTQTFFNVPVVFNKVSDSAVVRARYVSYNPGEVVPANNTDAVFYSCADVKVIKAGKWGNGATVARKEKSVVPTVEKKMAVAAAKMSGSKMCQTPPRFHAVGPEIDFQGNVILMHTISYDTVVGAVKWERSNKMEGGDYSMTNYWNLTQTAAGYTPQYIVNVNGDGTCAMYGGDMFFPWQYGSQVGMQFMGNMTEDPTMTTMLFGTLSTGMSWSASIPMNASYCLPSITQQRTGNMIMFTTSEAVDSFPSGHFNPPAMCMNIKQPNKGCWAHRLAEMEKMNMHKRI